MKGWKYNNLAIYNYIRLNVLTDKKVENHVVISLFGDGDFGSKCAKLIPFIYTVVQIK